MVATTVERDVQARTLVQILDRLFSEGNPNPSLGTVVNEFRSSTVGGMFQEGVAQMVDVVVELLKEKGFDPLDIRPKSY